GGAAPWSADLRLVGVGDAARALPPEDAKVTARGNRVELTRGDVTEWYVNGPLGLEQGFTLAARPATLAQAREIVIDVAVGGGLVPFAAGVDAIDLRDAKGNTALRVRDVFATDAAGKTLPAHLRLAERTLRLSVDDRGATYPIVIDPMYASDGDLVALDGAPSSHLGRAVAVDGDTAILG